MAERGQVAFPGYGQVDAFFDRKRSGIIPNPDVIEDHVLLYRVGSAGYGDPLLIGHDIDLIW